MHKSIILIFAISLSFASVYSNDDSEPLIPDVRDLPSPFGFYSHEYIYSEVGITSLLGFNIYLSRIKYNEKTLLNFSYAKENGKFFKLKLSNDDLKMFNGVFSSFFSARHTEDSSGFASYYKSSLNYIKRGEKLIFKITPTVAFVPKALSFYFINNCEMLFENSNFNFGFLSKWQRIDRLKNSHFGAYFEKDFVRYGLFYSGAFFPFLSIKSKDNSDFTFSFDIESDKIFDIEKYSIYSEISLLSSNYIPHSVYYGKLDAKYNLSQFEFFVYADIDTIENYQNIGRLCYSALYDYRIKTANYILKAQISYQNNGFLKYAKVGSFSTFKDDGNMFNIEATAYFYNHQKSLLLSPFITLSGGAYRVSFGAKNVFSQYIPDEWLYSPVRSYFFTIIYSNGTIFGSKD